MVMGGVVFFFMVIDTAQGEPSLTIILKEGVMLKEFKEFAMRGNVVDMAVGIVIGGAFGKIIASFV